jgi:Smg protein
MFEVLVYVYENYWQGDACPELHQLSRKLSAAGFEADEIQAALVWLDGLNVAAHGT